jgi:hypothetical protein
MSAPTKAGRPGYLPERASVSICKVSQISAQSNALVFGEKKMLHFAKLTNCPELVQYVSRTHCKEVALFISAFMRIRESSAKKTM